MFWKKKPKLPITEEDQKWVEQSLTFLRNSIGEKTLLSVTTVTPTPSFFDRDFDTTEEDAHFILERCTQLMSIEDTVQLEFFSEKERVMDDGTVLSTTADIYGRSKGAVGTYQKNESSTTIRLEKELLKDPNKLIATMSHELAHHKLLGENRIHYNDEYLTDLTAIAFGFGIFLGNSRFQFQSGLRSGFGWQMSSQGYLPEQLIAYAMATLSLKKNETDTSYTEYLTKTLRTDFTKSRDYLQHLKKDTFWSIPSPTLHESVEKPEPILQEPENLSAKEIKELQQKMIWAVYENDVITVQELLQRKISPNFNGIGGSPLAIATMSGNKEIMDTLIAHGADVNFSESESLWDITPLMKACESGNLATIRYLVEEMNSEINFVAGNNQSPLQVAVENGHLEAVELLLKYGANLEIKSGYGSAYTKTPICFAVEKNNKEMVSFLVKKGAKTKPIRKLPRHEINRNMIKFLKSRKYL